MLDKIDNLIKSYSKSKILVLSGWWLRWLYTVWVLKWLEELWIDKDIPAVFGVSIWAIVWWLWCSWVKAEQIFQIFIDQLSLEKFYWKEIFTKTWWMLSNKKIKGLIDENILDSFDKLNRKFYVWVVNANTADYLLMQDWDLHKIILWSMSIPWVFPPVKYKDLLMVDWWLLNNFPVDIAKKYYPHNKIIWVALNWFEKNQKITTAWDNLTVSYAVVMRSQILKNNKLVDYLFYKEIDVPTLTLNKSKLKNAYEMWYNDCLAMFK